MGRISRMSQEMECWDGVRAVVRPLTWGEREEADNVRIGKAIERAKGIDVGTLLGGNLDQSSSSSGGEDKVELDYGVAVRHGLISYDGEAATEDLINDLDARTIEQLGRRIERLSTLGDAAPLSAKRPAGSEGETGSR